MSHLKKKKLPERELEILHPVYVAASPSIKFTVDQCIPIPSHGSGRFCHLKLIWTQSGYLTWSGTLPSVCLSRFFQTYRAPQSSAPSQVRVPSPLLLLVPFMPQKQCWMCHKLDDHAPWVGHIHAYPAAGVHFIPAREFFSFADLKAFSFHDRVFFSGWKRF